MSADLIDLVAKLGRPRVLVVGDLMLDRYVWGDAERISQEAPVILLHADEREERLGGASNVATMLNVLGADVAIAGVVGNDVDGNRIRAILTERDIDLECILTDPGRPSTVKERYMGRAQQKHPQQMLRVDYEVRDPLCTALEERLCKAVESQVRKADIVLISDYDKGVCTPLLTQHIITAARQLGKRVLIDPIRCKSSEEPHTYRKYQNCSAIKLNRVEAGLAAGRAVKSSEDAMNAGRFLLDTFGLEAAVVSLDKDGIVLVHSDGRRQVFPTRQRQVYDITGAGDMVLSVMGMALAAGADYEQAVRLANIAGGLEVEKIGVVSITREEILADLQSADRPSQRPRGHGGKLVNRRELVQELDSCRRAGHTIAFTNGCFDILHAGHVQYLQEARAQADVLVVGLNSDDSVSRLKGPHRPINPEAARADVLAGLAAVDYIALFDELTPLDLITAVRPDVLVKGADYRKEQVVGAEFVESYGGRVHLAALKAGYSTTNLATKMVA